MTYKSFRFEPVHRFERLNAQAALTVQRYNAASLNCLSLLVAVLKLLLFFDKTLSCVRVRGQSYPFLTQKERDIETGLDYSINRYYSYMQGRFTSVDPTLLSVQGLNPQTWNRYAYVLNNPLRFIDPLGLWELDPEIERDKKGKIKNVTLLVKKSKEGDNAASLVKQLGIDPSSKAGQKLMAKIEKQLASGDTVQLSKVGGIVGQVYGAAEHGLTAQAKFAEAHPSSSNGRFQRHDVQRLLDDLRQNIVAE